MTLTIHLSDTPTSQFLALMPEEKREEFVAEAIADAVALRQDATREAEARLLAVLNAELDPEKEPERDSAECMAAVEAAWNDIDNGGALFTLDEVRRRWDAERAAKEKAGAA